jgi:hypothetical protein
MQDQGERITTHPIADLRTEPLNSARKLEGLGFYRLTRP